MVCLFDDVLLPSHCQFEMGIYLRVTLFFFPAQHAAPNFWLAWPLCDGRARYLPKSAKATVRPSWEISQTETALWQLKDYKNHRLLELNIALSSQTLILTEESTSWNHKSLMPHPCECCCRIPTPQDQGFSLCLSEVLRLRGRKSRENTSTKQNTPPQYLLSECSWGMEYPSVSVPFLHFHGHRIMVQRAGFCTLHNHFRPDMGYSDF